MTRARCGHFFIAAARALSPLLSNIELRGAGGRSKWTRYQKRLLWGLFCFGGCFGLRYCTRCDAGRNQFKHHSPTSLATSLNTNQIPSWCLKWLLFKAWVLKGFASGVQAAAFFRALLSKALVLKGLHPGFRRPLSSEPDLFPLNL